jgi:carboxypeptidase family protein
MVMKRVVACLVGAIVLAFPAASHAQTERGAISGLVSDSTKGGLPGVAVTITNTATNQTTNVFTSDSGTYSVTNLSPGRYRVEAALSGFRNTRVDNVQLGAGATTRIDITLEIGNVAEAVNVVANQTFLQTMDARTTTNVPNQLIDQLPLVVGGAMRSVFDLVSTVAETKGSGTTVSLGGGQAGAFGATLDGVSVNTNRNANTVETNFLTPSVEAITEFSVETNGFKPEFGQAGGGAITFASKSGTNRFQGSAYNFFRDDALDAKPYFASSKAVYKQNNFGGSFGGPVKLPGYNGKDKTFFFASYEGFINKQGSNATFSSVPTPEMYLGDFSNLVDRNGNRLIIYDPATTRPNPNGTGFIRDPFPGNKIPVERFSAVAKAYIALASKALVPNQNGAPGTFAYINNNFKSNGGYTKETTNKYSVKFDHILTGNQRVSYLFNRANDLVEPGASGPVGLPVPFNSASRDTFDADLHRASWDLTHAGMVNHFTFGLNTFNKDSKSINVGGDWKSQGICIPNVVDCNVNFGQMNFSEFSGWGGAADNGTEQPRWSIKDDLSMVKGKHSLKTGFSFDRQQANGFGQQQIAGSIGFDFRNTSVPGATTQTSGSSFASFLLGTAFTGNTETIRYLQQVYPYYAMYGQDDWRINSKVTVNYGVRYEFTTPPHSGGDQYTDFDPLKPNPAVNNYPGALIFAGDGPGREGKSSLVPGYYAAIAPRASMAYSPNDKTTIRAAVGRSFGRVTVTQGSSHYAGFIGQYAFTSADNGVTPTFMLDSGLPAYPLPPKIDPSFSNNDVAEWWNGSEATRPAVYDNWTFSMQRELWNGLTGEVEYNGTNGSHLQAGLMNPNQVPLSVVNALIAKYGVPGTVALLQSDISSATAVAAGIPIPYPNFTNPSVQRVRTVAQALRPFPQYSSVNVAIGGGDKTGSSMYHAIVFKANQRLRKGLAVQSSYTWSRIMTDADQFSGSGGSLDAAQPGLEYSIGRLDQTHNIKLNTVYELPFGKGKPWLNDGFADAVLGGWRLALTQQYISGLPIGVTSNAVLPIFNGTNRPDTTGQPWRAPIAGSEFNPLVDVFLNKAAFVQPVDGLGNAPRINGDVRRPWNLNENLSVAKTFKTHAFSFDVRVEAFNLFNRVVWGAPVTNFSSNTFGQISSQANTPRQMQIGLKLYW